MSFITSSEQLVSNTTADNFALAEPLIPTPFINSPSSPAFTHSPILPVSTPSPLSSIFSSRSHNHSISPIPLPFPHMPQLRRSTIEHQQPVPLIDYVCNAAYLTNLTPSCFIPPVHPPSFPFQYFPTPTSNY